MVIAIFFNAITEMTTKQENIMELLDMRDDCLIDEWAKLMLFTINGRLRLPI